MHRPTWGSGGTMCQLSQTAPCVRIPLQSLPWSSSILHRDLLPGRKPHSIETLGYDVAALLKGAVVVPFEELAAHART